MRIRPSLGWLAVVIGSVLTGSGLAAQTRATGTARANTAVVEGRVTDEAGDPMVDVMVHLIVRDDTAHGWLRKAAFGTTNDLGVFRIAGIAPGAYLVGVGSAGQGPRSDANGYPTTFYPAATSVARAIPVTLAAGEVREHLDLALARGTRRVSGDVTGLERRGAQGAGAGGRPTVQLSLLPADAPETPAGFETARASSDTEHRFVFTDVPPGRYVVRVVDFPRVSSPSTTMVTPGIVYLTNRPWALAPTPNEPTLWAEKAITVGAADVGGVAIALTEAARISGRVEFSPADLAPSAEGRLRLPIAVQAADGRDIQSYPVARIEADGTFRTVGLPPGAYTFHVVRNAPAVRGDAGAGPDWMTSAVVVGDRGAPDGTLTLGARDVTNVLLKLTARR